METMSLIGILIALVLLVLFVMKGADLFVSVIVCSIVIAITGGMNVYDAMIDTFMSGFVTFVKSYYPLFAVGAILGKLMEVSGAAMALANLATKISKGNGYVVIPIVAGILTYGGIHCFVAMLATLPIAVAIYKKDDLPHRYLPASVFFGAATFGMVAPGAIQIQNIIPCDAMGVPYTSGMVGGWIAAIFMGVVGTIWLKKMIDKAKAAGEGFGDSDASAADDIRTDTPSGIVALIPLIVAILLINVKVNGASIAQTEVALLIGSVVLLVLCHKYISIKKVPAYIGESAKTALSMVFSVALLTGFGTVIKATPAFQLVVGAVESVPGSPLIGAALGVLMVCGVCGSASGGLAIAAPILAPIYLESSVAATAVARVMSIASCSFDSLPHNSGLTGVVRDFCGETHARAYMPLFWLTVFLPLIATIIAIAVYTVFPNLP